MSNGDEASPNINLAGHALLEKNAQNSCTAWYILIKFCMVMFKASGMQNGDEASLSNILAGRALLMKILITLTRMVYFVQILYTYLF